MSVGICYTSSTKDTISGLGEGGGDEMREEEMRGGREEGREGGRDGGGGAEE